MKSTIGIDSQLENWRIGERNPFSFNCMACKVKGKASNICKFKDPLTPILEEIAQADGLVLGRPSTSAMSPAKQLWRDLHWEADLQKAFDAGRRVDDRHDYGSIHGAHLTSRR